MLLNQIVEDSIARYDEEIAVVYEKKSTTYKQLKEKVSKLADAILTYAENEPFIGITTTRSIEMIIGTLAIIKAGKAYLPLDPKYPLVRLEQMVDDARLRYTLCFSEEDDFFGGLGLLPIKINGEYNLPHLSPTIQNPVVCVLFTSGSTGRPKGVCLGHQGLINQIEWQKAHGTAGPGVKSLQFCHLSFDGAFLEIFVPLCSGGTLYVVNDNYRFNTGNLLRYIIENGINRLFLGYAIIQFLAETAQLYNLYPTTVKEIITGGELLRLTPQITNFFTVLPDCVLMNVYGPTEASVWVTEYKLKGNAQNWPVLPPIGKAVAGVNLYLVDENFELVNEGATGEIFINGDCIALYYLNKPEQTAERFFYWQHPLLGEIRIYRTGDLASLNDDGTLQFQGRNDQQVKIHGGYRVEPGEIEVVIGNMPGISQVVVMAREDIANQKKIVAYVKLSDALVTSLGIKNEVAGHLPSYMVPDSIVVLAHFPMTVSGKIDKQALPAPQKEIFSNNRIFIAPTNQLEEYLKLLWEELLNVNDIGIEDNFFDLGGSSIIAIQMMIRIEKETGKLLPLISVFNHSTIQKLALLILKYESPSEVSPLVAIKPTGNLPPVYLVHGDNLNVLNFNGLAKYINVDQPVYGLQPKGLDDKAEAFDRIEDIAKYYNEAIIKQNPDGPYAIAGYSFGGYVAFEMVKQLKQMGKPVMMLGLLDTHLIIADNFLSRWQRLGRKITRQAPKFLWISKSFLANPKPVINYQFTILKKHFSGLFKQPKKPIIAETAPYLNLMEKINERHHRALFNYNLEKYDGKIVLFKAMERVYFVEEPDFYGWGPFCTMGVEVYELPGDHVTMLTEPNCIILAKEMGKALLNAQKL